MPERCLIIGDDLTGGADAGAQFAKKGLSTLLISATNNAGIDFSRYTDRDVLVINTNSRGIIPDRAYTLVSNILKAYDEKLFPIVYKKIDSTLRGNIGSEVDAILRETSIPMGFIAPSFPEQKRTLIGGILMVGGKPLSLTEASSDAASPVKESHVYKLLEHQSSHKVGWIDLTHVASGKKRLLEAVEKETQKGNSIIIFDAVERRDLTYIADVAFALEKKPLLIGSAGLAEEVAKKLSPSRIDKISDVSQQIKRPFKHIFTISGSASIITHKQLKRVEKKSKISSFELDKAFFMTDKTKRYPHEKKLSSEIGNALTEGRVILKICPERLPLKDVDDTPISLEITERLGFIAHSTLEEARVNIDDLAVIIIGGDTAMSVFNSLGFEGVEIEGEILEGIVIGRLIGGNWNGLTVITKAGAFGKENALEKVIEILEAESP